MQRKRESRLVGLLMPDATDAEIQEATRRWFGIIAVLNDIAADRERADTRSHESPRDATIPVDTPDV